MRILLIIIRPSIGLEQRAIDFITENIFDIAKWGLLLLVLLYLIFRHHSPDRVK